VKRNIYLYLYTGPSPLHSVLDGGERERWFKGEYSQGAVQVEHVSHGRQSIYRKENSTQTRAGKARESRKTTYLREATHSLNKRLLPCSKETKIQTLGSITKKVCRSRMCWTAESNSMQIAK
jgi:hypothetical protein